MALLRLCGLWKTKNPKGKVVMSGKLLGLSVMIMRRDPSRDKSDRAPEFDLVLGEREEEGGGGKRTTSARNDDDIPF